MRGPGRAGELPAGADGLAGQPARLVGARATSTSSSTCWAPTRRCGHRGTAGGAPERRGVARRGTRRQARSAAVAGLPDDLHDALLRRRAAGRHLVREARPEHHRHAPVRALLQPGDRPAVADAHRLRRLSAIAEDVQRAGRQAPRRAQGPRRRCRCSTTRPDALANPHGVVRDWKAGECEPVPGRDACPSSSIVERDYGAVADEDGRAGPAGRQARR